MRVIVEDFSYTKDYENDCEISGGYGIPGDNEIHIDQSLPYEQMRLAVVHEVLDYYLSGRIKHSKIDYIAIDILDVLIQTKFLPELPDNEAQQITEEHCVDMPNNEAVVDYK